MKKDFNIYESALLFLIAGTFFMEQLDGTILVTGLPDIAKTFQILPAQLDVGVSAYLLTLAIPVPASGWVADHWGPRRIFMCAIIIFMWLRCYVAPLKVYGNLSSHERYRAWAAR
jgi:MFS family permease